MSEPIRLAVVGAAGRMGRRVVALASEDAAFKVVAAINPGSNTGKDAGELAGVGTTGVLIGDRIGGRADVVVSFSSPEAVPGVAEWCGQQGVPLVEATTGLTGEQVAAIDRAAERTAVVFAPSMSSAVNVAMNLTRMAAAALKDLPSGVDVEIVERHHRFKKDAPSGTAVRFGEIVASEMGQENEVHGRHGLRGERPRNEIGYHALRVGDDVGQHSIIFGMLGETLEISVRGQSRDSYAGGALGAAKWLIGRPPGRYSMNDVLGLTGGG